MIKIRIRDLEGALHNLEGKEGETLLETMLNAGLPIKADCYGCCNCSTCHVSLDPAWYVRATEPEEQETDVLELAAARTETSRLSCQVILGSECEGMEAWLMAETAP